MTTMRTKVLIFILLVLLLTMASRANSGEDGFASPKSLSPSTHEKARSSKGGGDGVECKKSDSVEECLVKKSVAAHTDYIYTQDLNLSP